MERTGLDSRKITSKLKPFGRQWRSEKPELLAAAIRMPEYEGPEHEHPEAQVAILLSSPSASFSHHAIVDQIHFPLAPGSFVYIQPGEPHQTQWHGWTELLNIYRKEDFLRELDDQSPCPLNQLSVSYRVDSVISSIGRILMDEFIRTETLPALMIDHGRALIASRLFRFRNSVRDASRLVF